MRYMLVFDDLEEDARDGATIEVTMRQRNAPFMRVVTGPRIRIPPGLDLHFRLVFEASDEYAASDVVDTITREGAPVGRWHIEPLDGMAEHGATS